MITPERQHNYVQIRSTPEIGRSLSVGCDQILLQVISYEPGANKLVDGVLLQFVRGVAKSRELGLLEKDVAPHHICEEVFVRTDSPESERTESRLVFDVLH
jgi:hypothetical protein